ncbi:MAG TPA: hypothetical protein PK402_13980, partial [Tepidisphaeraceae bacterium]|nr:hypothetical protein [Tepidisphaeraceae bacterium]
MRKSSTVIACFGLSLGLVSISSAAIISEGIGPTLTSSHSICESASLTSSGPEAVTSTIFSNASTFLGDGYANGHYSNGYSYAIADDLTTTAPASGAKMTAFQFSIANFNNTTENVLSYLRFFDDNGSSGAPGTYLGGVNLASASVAGMTAGLFSYTFPTADQIVIPSGKIWALVYFSKGSGTTNTEMNLIGQGFYNPSTVGSSTIAEWDSTIGGTGPSSFAANNPAGALYTGGLIFYATDHRLR